MLTDSSLKSAYHFSYGQETRLLFSIHWETFVFDARLVQGVYK